MVPSPSGIDIDEGQLLRLLVKNVVDYAILVLDVDGRILTWNEGAERLNGYTEAEIKLQHFSVFYTAEDIEDGKPTRELKIALEKGKYEEEGWRIRKDGSRFWAHVTIAPIRDESQKHIGFSKVTRDLSERRLATEREKLVHDVARLAAESNDFGELLQEVVSRIGHFLGWQVGHAYVWHPSSSSLKSIKTWYFENEPSKFLEFVKASEEIEFRPGEGLPGKAYESRKGIIISDLGSDKRFQRKDHLEGSGLQSAIWIPLIEKGKVFAVLEFFSDSAVAETSDILALADLVGTQVSLFMERHRALEDQEAFFNSSHDLLAYGRFDGTFTKVNPRWTAVLGFTEEEMLSHPWLFFVHPDDVERTMEAGAQLLEGKAVVLENRYKCKDGSYRWLQWHSVPLPGREAIYGIARDITDDKEIAQKLKETISLQNAILSSAPYAIISVDSQGIARTFNAGAEKMFGYRAEEFVDQQKAPPLTDPESLKERAADLSKILGKPTEATAEAFIELARRGIPHEFQWTYVRKDGSRFPGLLAVTALRNENNEVNGYLGIIQDITARRKAEIERGRLLAIIEQSPDLIGYGDEYGNVIYQNAGGNRLLGYPDDFDHSHMTTKDFHPEWVLKMAEDVVSRALTEKGVWQGETALLHRDGTEIPASQVVFLLPPEKGEPRYIATIAHDMTEYKKAEVKLAQQANDLRISNQELEQFAYVASHDLQEPLRMVCSFLGLLELEFGDQLNDEAKEYIQYAVDGGMRMRALIDGLLDFSRVGRQNVELVPTDMEAILNIVLTNLQLAITESDATITHDPLPIVIGDRMGLIRLLQNLISNSLKFRSDEPVKIHVGVKGCDGELLFSVKDNGIGIDPKHQEKIFMIFQRLHPKSKYPGSGIGLSICRKIVERHGGRLWLDTENKEGSQFFFTLKSQ